MRNFQLVSKDIVEHLTWQLQTEPLQEDPGKKRLLIFEIPTQSLRKDLQKAFEDIERVAQ